MKNQISIKDIQKYINYNSNIDVKTSSNETLGIDEWHFIENIEQDLELIDKGLTSVDFNRKTFDEIFANCDSEAVDFLLGKINCYKNFKNLVDILTAIRAKIDNRTSISRIQFSSIETLIAKLDVLIDNTLICNFGILEELNYLFAPTGTFQELSIENNWGHEFIDISRQFDSNFDLLIKKNKTESKKKKWWKIWTD